jgi:hypothetical protein
MGVREVEFEDLPAVAELFVAAGWQAPRRQDWMRLWVENPAVKIDRPRPCRGWVLEKDERLVGYMGNLTQLYSWEGRILRSATATHFFVLPEFRGLSLQLVLPFVRQQHVDLLLNTTASAEASQVFRFLKFARLPQPDFDVSMYWVSQPVGFVRAALRKKGLPLLLARVSAPVAGPVLGLEHWLRGRRPKSPGTHDITIDAGGAEVIGAEFDEFWNSKRAESGRLLAVRSAEILRHRFGQEGRAQPPRVIRAWRGERLVGYTICVRFDTPEIGLKRLRFADLMADQDDPLVVQELLAAAVQEARQARVDMLEVIGYPTHIRELLELARPLHWKRESWPYLYKTDDPVLQAALESQSTWYPTLLDGDGC